MSWLRPDNIPNSDYDAHKRVEAFAMEHGEAGVRILDCFNYVDPLHVFFGENVDEYVGYAKKFMVSLGDKKFEDLTKEEIRGIVMGSFHKSQIGVFASEEDIEKLIHSIDLKRGSS